jgi:hypothetical protein
LFVFLINFVDLITAQDMKRMKRPIFYVTPMFITMYTKARLYSLRKMLLILTAYYRQHKYSKCTYIPVSSSVVYMGAKLGCLTSTEGHRLRVFANRALRKISGLIQGTNRVMEKTT